MTAKGRQMTTRTYPRIVTPPPGPKGKAIIDRDAA